jgi:hypothetical protein
VKTKKASEKTETHVVVSSTNENQTPIFSVLVKRTYDIYPNGTLARADVTKPFVEIDEFYDNGDPEWSTVKYESEFAPYKTATDLVVIGKAHAPNGTPVQEMDVVVEVGYFRKRIHVIGDRVCCYRENLPPLFTDPTPFTEMEIRYERAYGGKDLKSMEGLEFHYPRNPMGTGIALGNNREVIEGLPLPNLEDPNDLLTPERIVLEDPYHWNRQPLPQGVGWFQKIWYPRCSFVGAMPGFVDVEEVMREELPGWVPRGQIALARQFKLPSFDVRFNNGASPGLVVPYLAGDEQINLKGLTQKGAFSLFLPGEIPEMTLDIGLGINSLEAFLQTVLVRVEDMQVDLIWQGPYEYPGIDWLPEMKRMDVCFF